MTPSRQTASKPTTSLYLDEATRELLSELARREERSLSHTMRRAIRFYAAQRSTQ